MIVLSRQLAFVCRRACASRRTSASITELPDIDLQLAYRPAQSIPVHAQFARGAALVALIFFEHGRDEAPLEFAHRFRIENIAFVHLMNEGFELIFHGISLSL